MMESARSLGLAARFVTGYLYDPALDHAEGATATPAHPHAWMEVYLPGVGWVEFDPTNGIVGNTGLIRVAVARDIYQAVPISGTWSGFPGSFIDMSVTVDVTVADPNAASAVTIGSPERRTA